MPLPFGIGWRAALVTGIGLSLSSTAFALQMLSEKKELTSEHGQVAFGILLFPDLAVIPVLAVLPLLVGVLTSRGARLCIPLVSEREIGFGVLESLGFVNERETTGYVATR